MLRDFARGSMTDIRNLLQFLMLNKLTQLRRLRIILLLLIAIILWNRLGDKFHHGQEESRAHVVIILVSIADKIQHRRQMHSLGYVTDLARVNAFEQLLEDDEVLTVQPVLFLAFTVQVLCIER